MLLLRYDVIGDMVTTLPMIHLLKLINPAMEVDVLASVANAPIIRHDAAVSTIYELPSSLWQRLTLFRRLRQRKYDIVFVCLFSHTTTIGLLANYVGGRRAIKATNHRGDKYALLFNHQSKVASQQISVYDRLLYLVTDTIQTQFTPQDALFSLAIDSASKQAADEWLQNNSIARKKYIAVNLSTRAQRNVWTEEGFRAVVKTIISDTPLPVVLLSMQSDAFLAERLEKLSPRIRKYQHTTNILEVAAVIDNASVLVTPDTSVVHIASARGVPLVSLYVGGTPLAEEWAPYRLVHKRVICSSNEAAVYTIPPEDVVAAFRELWEELQRTEYP